MRLNSHLGEREEETSIAHPCSFRNLAPPTSVQQLSVGHGVPSFLRASSTPPA
jgi:hypothetical protein